MNEEMVQKKASLLTFTCVTSEFSLNFNIGPIKPKLETTRFNHAFKHFLYNEEGVNSGYYDYFNRLFI